MRIHLACVGMMCGTYPDYLIDRFIECEGGPRIAELRSYWEFFTFGGHKLPVYGKPFFLDSGAYSAYSKGHPITIEEYTEFVLKFKDQVSYYANLDALPKDESEEARTHAAKESMSNQKYMEDAGLTPLPVFHMGEPWKYLEMYLEKYDFICLGGMVYMGKLDAYLDEVWGRYLVNDDGSAKCKVHGFGLTSLRQMTQFPWETVDSSTWLIHSKLGIIAYPRKKPDGSFDFLHRPTLVGVSEASTMKKDEGKHYDNMNPEAQKGVQEYLALHGYTIGELRTHPAPRFVVNLEYWIRVEQAITEMDPKLTARQHHFL